MPQSPTVQIASWSQDQPYPLFTEMQGASDITAVVNAYKGFPYIQTPPVYCPYTDEADIRADLDGDGDIDSDDNALEATEVLYFVVNSDDDNGNDIEDYLDAGPVDNEDDLVELRLGSRCPALDPDTAFWKISWTEPDPPNPALKVWLTADKSDGQGGPGSPIPNDLPQDWPPPESIWLEASHSSAAEVAVTATIVNNTVATSIVSAQQVVLTDLLNILFPCTPAPAPGERFWVGAAKSGTNITEVSAEITSDWWLMDPLCGQAAGATSTALSAIYVDTGVTIGGGPSGSYQIWVQTGAARERRAGSPFATSDYYAESAYGPDQLCGDGSCDRDIETTNDPLIGEYRYQVKQVFPDLGFWQYNFDGLPFHSFQHDTWKYLGGTDVDWTAEIFNLEDHLCGTPGVPCVFSDCHYSVNWGADMPDGIDPDDIRFDPPTPGRSQWDYLCINPTSFEVWDKWPF